MTEIARPPNYPLLPNLPNIPQPVMGRGQAVSTLPATAPLSRDNGQVSRGSSSSTQSAGAKADVDDSMINAIKALEPVEQTILKKSFERNPEKLFSVQVTQMKVVNHVLALNKLNYTHSKLSLWPEEFGDEPFSYENRFVSVDVSFFGLFNDDEKTAYNIFICGHNDSAPMIPLLTIYNEETVPQVPFTHYVFTLPVLISLLKG